MITTGSVTRDEASKVFPFLAEHFPGRRNAIRKLTHSDPEFVFWIYPDGRLHDARRSHRANPPKGYEHILDDEPNYCGFLRGRVVRQGQQQLIVVYCVPEALAHDRKKIGQFVTGVSSLPLPIDETAWVVSDNGDLYGTIVDVDDRLVS